jgi:glycopeptide antibiotics resistance protein
LHSKKLPEIETTMLYQLAKPMLLILAATIPMWWLLRLLYRSIHHAGPYSLQRESQNSFFLAYLVCLLCITLYPIPLVRIQSHGFSQVNLVPVKRTYNELNNILQSERKSLAFRSLQNIIGNILLFLPLGIFLPMVLGIKSFFKVLCIAAALSSGIELCQYILRNFRIFRSVDVDDIILNTTGALLGLALYALFRRQKNQELVLKKEPAEMVS